MQPRFARFLLFAFLLASLVCVASGRRPQQSIPLPLQTASIRNGMESSDFECRVDRRSPAPDAGSPHDRVPLVAVVSPRLEIPPPGCRLTDEVDPAAEMAPSAVAVSLLRARAPPATC